MERLLFKKLLSPLTLKTNNKLSTIKDWDPFGYISCYSDPDFEYSFWKKNCKSSKKWTGLELSLNDFREHIQNLRKIAEKQLAAEEKSKTRFS